MYRTTNGPNLFGVWQGSRDGIEVLNDTTLSKLMPPDDALDLSSEKAPIPFCVYVIDKSYIERLRFSEPNILCSDKTNVYCGPVYNSKMGMFFAPIIAYDSTHTNYVFDRPYTGVIPFTFEGKRYVVDVRRSISCSVMEIDVDDERFDENYRMHKYLKQYLTEIEQAADYFINPANARKRFDDKNKLIKSESPSDIPFGVYEIGSDYIMQQREENFSLPHCKTTNLYVGPVYTSDYPEPKSAYFVALVKARIDKGKGDYEKPIIANLDPDFEYDDDEEDFGENATHTLDTENYTLDEYGNEIHITEDRNFDRLMGFNDETLNINGQIYNLEFKRHLSCPQSLLTPVPIDEETSDELNVKKTVIEFCADFCWNPNHWKQLNYYTFDGLDRHYQYDLHCTFWAPNAKNLLYYSFFPADTGEKPPVTPYEISKLPSVNPIGVYSVDSDYIELLRSIDNRVVKSKTTCKYYGPIVDVTTQYGDVSFYVPIMQPDDIGIYPMAECSLVSHKAIPIPDNKVSRFTSDAKYFDNFIRNLGYDHEINELVYEVTNTLTLKDEFGEITPEW